SNVSNKLTVTLNVSPSVTLDGSSDVESPPRPNTSVLLPLLLSSAVPFSPSLLLSFSSPEQAASAVERTSSRIKASDQIFPFLIPIPPFEFFSSFLYHRRRFHHTDGRQQNDRSFVPPKRASPLCKCPFYKDSAYETDIRSADLA